MRLKFFFSLFMVVYLACPQYSQKKKSLSLDGNWESVTMENSRRLMMKLNPDSSFSMQTVLSADYSYRINGNKMITELLNERTGKMIIDTSEIEFKKGSVISIFKRGGKEEVTTMVRIPGVNKNFKSIVGKYTWKYPNDHIAFSEFTRDGKWIFRLPIQTMKGKYSIQNNFISFHYASADTLVDKQKFWLKKNMLILTNEKTQKENLYKRVDYFLDE